MEWCLRVAAVKLRGDGLVAAEICKATSSLVRLAFAERCDSVVSRCGCAELAKFAMSSN